MPATAGARARRDNQNGAVMTPAPTIAHHPAGLDTHATEFFRARFAPADDVLPTLPIATAPDVDVGNNDNPEGIVATTRNDTVRGTLTALTALSSLHECMP